MGEENGKAIQGKLTVRTLRVKPLWHGESLWLVTVWRMTSHCGLSLSDAWQVIVACHCLTHDKSLRLVTVLTLRSTIDEAGLLAFWARKVDCVCKGSDVAINVRLMLSDRPWGTFFPSRSRYKCVGKLGDAVLLSVFSFPFFSPFFSFSFFRGWVEVRKGS